MINSDKSDVLSNPSLSFMELQELLSSILQAAKNDPRVKQIINEFAGKKANSYLGKLQDGNSFQPELVPLYQAYTNLDSSCCVSFMDKNTLLKPYFVKKIEDSFNSMCKFYQDGLTGVAFSLLEEVYSFKQTKPTEFDHSSIKEDILNDKARKIATCHIKDLMGRILLFGKKIDIKHQLANEIIRISEVYNISLHTTYIPKSPISISEQIDILFMKNAG